MKSVEIALIVAGVMLTISLITKPKVDNNFSEIINSAEDIIEWINHDVKSGYLDSTRADSYIYNLEQIIKETE